jgi:hypothetical protein
VHAAGGYGAYWLPTVSWNGEVLDSNRAIFYYRTGGKNHKNVKPFPAELKVIARNPKYVSWSAGAPTTVGEAEPAEAVRQRRAGRTHRLPRVLGRATPR